MIVVMKVGSPEAEIQRVSEEFTSWGLSPEKIVGQHKVVIGLVGETAERDPLQIQEVSPWIETVLRVEKPFKRASIEYRHGQFSDVVVDTPNGPVTFGRTHPVVIVAGPCSVENEEMIIETAKRVKAAGAQFLRGGAYKPRTSPYAFQGHGESALGLLAAAREATGLGIITEIMDAADLDKLGEVADIIQVGARNMQNFSLLKKVGAQDKPVLLKRGMAATIDEWLMAAEYILGWVPKGTHDWKKFVKPSELAGYLRQNNLKPTETCGLIFNPLRGEFALSKTDLDVNYFMVTVR
jgi:3-deoxy-7-phosphoheptulonate synthase